VTEGDFSVIGRENPIIRQRHAVGVATEIVADMIGGAEGFFDTNDPGFFRNTLIRSLVAFSMAAPDLASGSAAITEIAACGIGDPKRVAIDGIVVRDHGIVRRRKCESAGRRYLPSSSIPPGERA